MLRKKAALVIVLAVAFVVSAWAVELNCSGGPLNCVVATANAIYKGNTLGYVVSQITDDGTTVAINGGTNLAASSKALSLKAAASGDADFSVPIVGSRTSADSQFGGIYGYHQVADVANLLFYRDSTVTGGYVVIQGKVGAGALATSCSFLGTGPVCPGNINGAQFSTAANCADSAGAAACGAAAAGAVVIDAAATSVVVSTTAVTADSQIFITDDSSLNTRLSVTCNTQALTVLGVPTITARTAGTSFTISIAVGPQQTRFA